MSLFIFIKKALANAVIFIKLRYPMKKLPLLPLLSAAFLTALVGTAYAQATYTAASSGNWAAPASWTHVSGPAGTFPNGVGDVAQRLAGGSVTITQNVTGNVTLGAATLGGIASGSLTLQVTSGNGLILNNGGNGATLTNSANSTSLGRLVITGNGTGTVTLADNLTVTNNSTSTLNTSGAISLGAAPIGGTGNLTINNVTNNLGYGYVLMQYKQSTFVGSVNIRSGAVTMSHSSSATAGTSFFGNSSNIVTLGSSGGGGVSLVAQGYTTTSFLSSPLVVASGTEGTTVIGGNNVAAANLTGAAHYSGTVTLNQDVVLLSAVSGAALVSNVNTTLFNNTISGTGGVTVRGTAADLGSTFVALGATQLTGNNTFSGDTRISSGSLAIGANGGGTNSLALQNSTLDLDGLDSGSLIFGTVAIPTTGNNTTTASLTTTATIGGLKGSRDLSLANYAAGAVTLSVGNNNANTDYSGAMSGAGAVTKIGSGALKLSGANTYAGATTVNAGSLIVNGSISNSAVTVNNTGTLGGTGVITPTGTNDITVASGGVVAPGDGGIESLELNLGTTTGDIVFSSGSTFTFDLNAPGSSDVLAIAGLIASTTEVTFNNNTINFNNLGGLAPGTYTLFTFDAASAYTGTLVLGTGLGGFAPDADLQYNATNIQLVIAAVPEPSTVALTVLGGLAGIFCLRRRRGN